MKEYKIQAEYSAKVLFEFSVAIGGKSFLVIYGEHVNGYFCCVPGYGWGCEMAEPSDVFYNRNKLMTKYGIPFQITDAIANSIKEMSEKQGRG